MEDNSELRNPFPSPPSHYLRYSDHNLKLLALLQANAYGTSAPLQHEVLSGERDIPDWPLKELVRPRVDWILEDGEYTVFGDLWQITERTPSLAELGGTQLYSDDPSIDRRPALQTVLRSLLLSYSSLLKSLLVPPLSIHAQTEHDWSRHMHWITVMCQNIIAAANDLRPAQARVNLQTMVRQQVELRRSETRSILEKCDALETMFEQLKGHTGSLEAATPSLETKRQDDQINPPIQLHDLLSFASSEK